MSSQLRWDIHEFAAEGIEVVVADALNELEELLGIDQSHVPFGLLIDSHHLVENLFKKKGRLE